MRVCLLCIHATLSAVKIHVINPLCWMHETLVLHINDLLLSRPAVRQPKPSRFMNFLLFTQRFLFFWFVTQSQRFLFNDGYNSRPFYSRMNVKLTMCLMEMKYSRKRPWENLVLFEWKVRLECWLETLLQSPWDRKFSIKRNQNHIKGIERR